MGSYNFETIVMTTGTAQDAYCQACSDAQVESGNNGYNGTISTTNGVYVVPTDHPLTRTEAALIVEERLDNLHKWDVCEAVPIVDETPAQYVQAPNIVVTVELAAAAFNDHDALRAAIAKKADVKADEIVWFSVAIADRKLVRNTTTRVEAKATEGKTETRYFISSPQDGTQTMPTWDQGHPSQAAARAAIPADQVWGLSSTTVDRDYEIIGITRRVDGEPLVKATVTVRKVEATFTVHTRRKTANAVVGTVQAGWLFYGWAAS